MNDHHHGGVRVGIIWRLICNKTLELKNGSIREIKLKSILESGNQLVLVVWACVPSFHVVYEVAAKLDEELSPQTSLQSTHEGQYMKSNHLVD